MPYYQFIVPSGGATLLHKAEVAEAMTTVHSEVTGAPRAYVHCAFVEVAEDGIYVAGKRADGPRMVGLIRDGRSVEIRSTLIHGIADAWSAITGDAKEDLAIFIEEIPGANVMEDGAILPEITDEPGAVY
ncbi:tautomerase family protein [Pseudonocardia oroxyli]|uniref:Phenylpyruvate tautomerase PptA, 4-oxalocrotonate tautomerase family n=1 Tax=Pseudonocardia oroxyli TaxID=366584 RepID=A0A1G7RKL6_PSEOR|nr:tautomerase family protein [Pseudonocardia oroxyli]SDG11245.1 Phenylpyruvate tautomerase PptA, 4-oxalocrotonate tautomerase family [Pseudonocardia oroxyli]